MERELILVKVACTGKTKAKLESVVEKYQGSVIQCKNDTAIIEAVGEQVQIKQLLEDLNTFGVKELVRTGKIAVAY